jgi:hypothetical protein
VVSTSTFLHVLTLNIINFSCSCAGQFQIESTKKDHSDYAKDSGMTAVGDSHDEVISPASSATSESESFVPLFEAVNYGGWHSTQTGGKYVTWKDETQFFRRINVIYTSFSRDVLSVQQGESESENYSGMYTVQSSTTSGDTAFCSTPPEGKYHGPRSPTPWFDVEELARYTQSNEAVRFRHITYLI